MLMKSSFCLLAMLVLATLPGFTCFRLGRSPLRQSCTVRAASSPSPTDNSIFIFGLGYVGTAVAEYLQALGWKVSGTCTNVNKALEFRKQGINSYLFDEQTVRSSGPSEATADILNSNYILSTIPPVAEGRQDLAIKAHFDDFRKARLSHNLKWIGYLSSTGVYGDCNGAWVTEDHTPRPENSKAGARLDAEEQWSDLHQRSGLPVHAFRLAGIYGPGRSAMDSMIDQYNNQHEDMHTFPADDSQFISRIHVDDIVKVLHASMLHPQPGSVYNVADDIPSTRYDVMSYCAKLLQLPNGFVVPTKTTEFSRGGNKRVDNARMKQLLAEAGSQLSFPDYRSGLSSLAKLCSDSEKVAAMKQKVLTEIARFEKGEGDAAEQMEQGKLQAEIEALQSKVSSLESKMHILELNQELMAEAINNLFKSEEMNNAGPADWFK